jgi:hypothetical protein
VAEAEGGGKQTRRQAGAKKRTTTAGETRRSSTSSSGDTPGSSATSSTPSNPLGLEQDSFEPPDRPVPADDAIDDLYEPAPPELLEWTPERAGSIVRAGGFLLHTADSLSREPEGTELWRATEADVEAMGPPLARILNRYEPARRLAGVADEGELAFAMISYARRNLVERGRVAMAKRDRDAELEAASAEAWPQRGDPTQPPPAT